MRERDPIPIHAADVNRVVLVGVLSESPEVHQLGDGASVCFLALDCLLRRSAEVPGDGEPFHVNVLLLGASAARIALYLYAGRRVVVDGSLQSAHWEGPAAHQSEAVCVLAQRVEFLGPAPEWLRLPADRQYRSASLLVPDTSSVVGFSEHMWF
jgi:single-stranded DNA-binding protein